MEETTAISELGAQSGDALSRGLDWLQAGGPVVMVLLAMSVMALAMVLLKLYQFRRMRLGQRNLPRQVLAMYRAGQSRDALELARSSLNPVAQLLSLGIGARMRRNLPEEKIREELYRVGADLLENLRAFMRPLEVIGSLAPLLGLFGTVLGMIEAFRQLASAGSRVDPAMLSGGIWEALLTTAVGLAVAIPVVAVANLFDRVLARLAHEMNDAISQLFTAELHPLTQAEEPARVAADLPAHAVAAGQ